MPNCGRRRGERNRLSINTSPTFPRMNNLGYIRYAIQCILYPCFACSIGLSSDTEVNELPSPSNQTSRLDSSTQETSVADSQVKLSPSNEVLNRSVLINKQSN